MSALILDCYKIGFHPVARGIGAVFARRESRVLWLVVRSTHRVSSIFADDCLRVAKAFRKYKPKDPETFERLLWKHATDPSLQCPFRPSLAPLIDLGRDETMEEHKARVARLREQWLVTIEELRLAMLGKRKPNVKFEIILPDRNN